MSKQVISMLYPVLMAIVTGVVAYVGKQTVKIVPKVIDLITAKVGIANYQKLKNIAWDIWNIIEEDNRLGELTISKISAFETLMKAKIPSITDEEINTFRQAIAGEYNKDKPIIEKAIESPVQEITIKPTIKYIAEDGTELQPVTISNDTSTPTAEINPIQDNVIAPTETIHAQE